jgi:hypothetical protein
MSYSRITNLLPSKNTVKSGLYTGLFITIHIAAWLDREQDNENNPPITLSLLSKIVASIHTAAALAEILDDLSLASLHSNLGKYKAGAGGMLAGSFASVAGVWATTDSKANMIFGVANATFNGVGRLFSGTHRNIVMAEEVINFEHLEQKAEDDSNQMERGESYRTLAAS